MLIPIGEIDLFHFGNRNDCEGKRSRTGFKMTAFGMHVVGKDDVGVDATVDD